MFDTYVAASGAITAVFAAILWFAASLTKVPDNIDTFIYALQKASRINAWGAFFASASALCNAYSLYGIFINKLMDS